MVYSTRRFVLYLTLCHFDLVFFSPFSIAITSLGEERANLSAFHTCVRFLLVWMYLRTNNFTTEKGKLLYQKFKTKVKHDLLKHKRHLN